MSVEPNSILPRVTAQSLQRGLGSGWIFAGLRPCREISNFFSCSRDTIFPPNHPSPIHHISRASNRSEPWRESISIPTPSTFFNRHPDDTMSGQNDSAAWPKAEDPALVQELLDCVQQASHYRQLKKGAVRF